MRVDVQRLVLRSICWRAGPECSPLLMPIGMQSALQMADLGRVDVGSVVSCAPEWPILLRNRRCQCRNSGRGWGPKIRHTIGRKSYSKVHPVIREARSGEIEVTSSAARATLTRWIKGAGSARRSFVDRTEALYSRLP